MIDVVSLKKYDNRQFVEQAYISILNRAGDEDGIKACLNSMARGVSKDDIIFSLRMSEEGINVNNKIRGLSLPSINVNRLLKYNDERFIDIVYIAVLGRTADLSEKFSYLSSLRSGEKSKEEILHTVINSDEAKKIQVKVVGEEKSYKKRMMKKAFFSFPIIGRIVRYIWNLIHINRILNDRIAVVNNKIETLNAQILEFNGRLTARTDSIDAKMLDFNGRLTARTDSINAKMLDFNGRLTARTDSIDAKMLDFDERLTVKTKGISAQRFEDDEKILRNLLERAGRVEGTARQNRDRLDERNIKIEFLRKEISDIKLEITKNDISKRYTERAHVGIQYKLYEDKMRGARKEIKDRLTAYDSVVKNVKANNGNDIFALDLGCGRGEWLELLGEKHNVTAIGVDSDYSMVKECNRRNLNVVQSDIVSYLRNAEGNSADIITLFQVVEHLPAGTLSTVIREAYRILSKGGVIIMETPNPENIIVGACNFYFDPTHIRPIPPATLSVFAENSGFKDIEIARLHLYGAIEADKIEGVTLEQRAIKQLAGFLNNYSDYALIAYKK